MANFDEVILRSLVCLNMHDKDGQHVITTLIEAAVQQGLLSPEHREEAILAVLKREQSASTALPDGIALPHGRTDCVTDIVCMIGIHPEGVDFGAPDNLPSTIFVLLLVPATVGCKHIHFLANLSRRLMEQSVRYELLAASTREQLLQVILSHSDEGFSS
jgi:mannitol/fructose-specific phosphotransferase system IIA component (Ntr-type)